MNASVLETFLQLLMQGSTASVAVAVGLTVVVAVLGRVLLAAVGTETPARETISDGGTTAHPSPDASDEELEHRLDELETEVDSLSSTVKTVRDENEQISESVRDIEENTGRLLSLYRMATRGANPFASVSEEPESAAVAGGTSEDEEFSREDEIEEIDTAVADDSAADLFDSSGAAVREQHCVDSVEEVVDSGDEPDDAFQRTKQAEQRDGGFEAVFETKTATEPADEDRQFGTEEMIETDPESTQAASDGGKLLEPTADSPETTTSTDSTVDPEPGTESTPSAETEQPEQPTDPERGEEPAPRQTPPAIGPATESPAGTTGAGDGKPYVESLPEGVSADVMTVEWLEYLVDEVGIRGTVRALDYYETIGWLTEEAVEELDAYLAAFEDPQREDLSVEHHLRSLDYVEELRHASDEQ